MRAGVSFKSVLDGGKPLQVVGVINAYVALMAERLGFRALYLSGAGVANSSLGLPDVGVTTLEDVLIDAGRITRRVNLPLLVDIDTGWEDIGECIRQMEKIGVAAVHLEDQTSNKRCGHLDGKELVSKEAMCERIKEAVNARQNSDFMIMARTDALGIEAMDVVVDRVRAYADAGADLLFAEAIGTLDQYKVLKDACGLPILANMTEFGKTPLWTLEDFAKAEVDMVLYPLSANRAMNKAAHAVLETILKTGTQADAIAQMQTREELYEELGYHQ